MTRTCGSDSRSSSDTSRSAGLTPTTNDVVGVASSIDVSNKTVTTVWRELFERNAVRDAFIRGVRNVAAGKTVSELYDQFEEMNIPYWLQSRYRNVAVGHRVEAIRLFENGLVPKLGHGRSTVEDIEANAALFEYADVTPTIAFVVTEEFTETARDQREAILQLIATLSKTFDVRLVATRVRQLWLRKVHRSDLPGVSEWLNTPRAEPAPLQERIDTALVELDPDGRKVEILRQLAAEPTETLSRHELASLHDVSRSRLSQVLVSEETSLSELGLIDEFGHDGDRRVELLEAGLAVLDAFDDEIGRQANLDEAVSDSGNSSPQCRVTPRTGEGGGEDSRPYHTVYADRPTLTAAACTGRDGTLTFVEGPLDDTDRRSRPVSYDPDEDEAVIVARSTGPLQYSVSVAEALASPRFIDRALPVDRLKQIDKPTAILRSAHNIGCLSSEALQDPQVLRDDLIEWGERIEEDTTKLKHGEYDDRDSFRSAIVRSAKGLAGSIVHLLYVVGVDLTREIRVPGELDLEKDLEPLAKSIAISAAIESTYLGSFAAYRQLFDVPNADQPPLSPDVDASNPTGSLIGSIVIRGPDVHRLRPAVEHYLEAPQELVEDSPEFSISIPIRDADRQDFAAVTTRILSRKNIRPTREAVSILHGLVATPHDVARVLVNRLGSEETTREIRAQELRVALAGLDEDAILPELTSTVSAVVAALLPVERPVSQTELADLADVSARAIRDNRAALEGLDLVRITDEGYRLSLSFNTREERRDEVVPEAVRDNTLLLDVVDSLLVRELPPDRYGDPDDPVGGVLFWPPDPWALAEIDDFEPWLRVAACLTGAEAPDRSDRTVSMGPSIEQTALVEPTEDSIDPVST